MANNQTSSGAQKKRSAPFRPLCAACSCFLLCTAVTSWEEFIRGTFFVCSLHYQLPTPYLYGSILKHCNENVIGLLTGTYAILVCISALVHIVKRCKLGNCQGENIIRPKKRKN